MAMDWMNGAGVTRGEIGKIFDTKVDDGTWHELRFRPRDIGGWLDVLAVVFHLAGCEWLVVLNKRAGDATWEPPRDCSIGWKTA